MDESAGQAEHGTASGGIILGPGEGRTIPGTDAITLIATGEETGGSIRVFEDISPGTDRPATSTTARTSCSTSSRESTYFWLESGKKACRLGRMSSSLGEGSTPSRSSGPSGEGCLWLSSQEDRSRPLRSSSSCAPRAKR
jgi:hypothetical protein